MHEMSRFLAVLTEYFRKIFRFHWTLFREIKIFSLKNLLSIAFYLNRSIESIRRSNSLFSIHYNTVFTYEEPSKAPI